MSSERSYVYKINFVDGHYYYGKRILKQDSPISDGYYGTPVTHKEKWNTTMFCKEVIEVYNNWYECSEKEKELIEPHLNNPLCLNENCGGYISLEGYRKGGSIGGKLQPLEVKKSNGKKARDHKLGMFSLTQEERKKIGKKSGLKQLQERVGIHTQTIEDRKKMGEYCRDNKIGIHAMSKEERTLHSKKLGAQKWQCTITGKISTGGGLTIYQENRNIYTSNRIKIK